MLTLKKTDNQKHDGRKVFYLYTLRQRN